MKKLWLIITLFAAVILAADEVLCIPTLIINGSDQQRYVPPYRGLSFVSVSEVEYGQPFTLKFFLALKSKVTGKTRIYGDLTVKDPAGKTVEILKGQLFFELDEKNFGIVSAKPFIKAVFETDDLPGKYEYVFTLHHPQDGEISSSAVLELKDTIVDAKAMKRDEFSSFMTEYYRNPRPARLLAAWDFYLKEGIPLQKDVEKEIFNPMANLTGFYEMFKINPQFHDELAAMSGKSAPENRIFYAVLFAGLGEEFCKKYQSQIDPQVLQLIREHFSGNPFELTEISQGFHLDMLWMTFFATGAFEPVKRICSELRKREMITMETAVKRKADNKPLNDEEKKLFMNYVMQSAALWSLESNAGKDHRLLTFYLETVLSEKMFADDQEAEFIKLILSKKSKQGNEK